LVPGFAIKQDRLARTISINQRTYVEAMLNKFRLTNAKPVSTPWKQVPNFRRNRDLDAYAKQCECVACHIGGNWMCVMAGYDNVADCALRSNPLAIHSKSGNVHWEALKRVMVYLSSTKDLWPHLWRTEPKISLRILYSIMLISEIVILSQDLLTISDREQ